MHTGIDQITEIKTEKILTAADSRIKAVLES